LKARIIMEEMYATLSVTYDSIETKKDLMETINLAIEKCTLTPDIYVKPFSQTEPGKGKVVIEFSPAQDRRIGEFFEYLIKENNLICE